MEQARAACQRNAEVIAILMEIADVARRLADKLADLDKEDDCEGVKPMSRMADLDAAIAELRKCGEAIISVSDALRTSFSTETEQPAPQPLPTIDQVRALLAEKSGEGKTKEVKALLNKYDAGSSPA